MNRILKSFARQTDAKLLAIAEKIDTCIPHSPLFDNIHPTVDVFKTNIATYKEKLAAAADRGRLAVAAKNEARKALVHTLVLWASCIEDHADTNESSILATGFELIKKPTRGIPPSTPENVRLLDSKLSGEALVRYKGVANAAVYEVRWRKEGEELWQSTDLAFSTRALLRGIERGTAIWAQVRAINANGISNWSGLATIMVR
jgi:hypothetical protein